MTKRIVNGKMVGQHYAEMTHLDRILDAYQQQAESYYKAKNALENAPPDVREQRAAEVKSIKAGLEHQRLQALALADAEAQLVEYRDRARASKASELQKEEHHPTDTLEFLMLAAHKPKPDSRSTAHHIVPGKGKHRINYQTRVHLHVNSIGINDPDNGVYLPQKKAHTPHWNMPESLGHKQYHTHGYEIFINRKLTMKPNEQAIRTELKLIGLMLQQNNLPPEARKKS